MASMQGQAKSLQQEGKRVAREATTSPLMETLLRLGYLARGLVYGVIGLLALQVALGGGGTLTDPQGAIVTMGRSGLGHLLLYVIFIGLVGYGLWGFIRAIVDPLHKGTDAKGIAERIGYAISGISYWLLALPTYNLITAKPGAAQSGAQTAQTQKTTADILSNSWGPWVIGIVAVIIILAGLLQIMRGLNRDFDKQFKPYLLDRNQQKWITRVGQFGMAARGLVFTLMGLFLFSAAYFHDPKRAQGIDGALYQVLHQPYGVWLLGIIALGLIAFGIYSALCGFWLRLKRS